MPSEKLIKTGISVALLTLAIPAIGFADETDFFTPYVSYSAIYDSNVFRLSDAASPPTGYSNKSDTIQQLGAGMDFRIPVSLQHYSAHLGVSRNIYRDFDFLDYTGIDANLLWDWAYGDLWKGKLGYNFTQDISSFEEFSSINKDERRIHDFLFNAGRKLSTRWESEFQLGHQRRTHDLAVQQKLDRNLTSGSAELRYSTLRYSYVGILASIKKADFPNRELVAATLVDNSYDEKELSVTVNWVTTGKSRLKGRVGYTRRDHDEYTQRDFSGGTGKLDYIWEPGAKLRMNFYVWKDIDAYTDSSASYVDETGVGFKPVWALTPKIEFSGELSRKKRDFAGDPGLIITPGPSREDTIKTASVTMAYMPRRNITGRISYIKEKRDSNIALNDYDYYALYGSVEIRF